MGTLIGFDSGDLDGVDPRLVEIVTAAAQSSPYNVQLTDGMRSGGKGNHKHGYAIDIKLVDPSTGKALPNKIYQSGKIIPGALDAVPAYEQIAKAAREYQQQQYPALGSVFRWGGGFRGGGTPFDMMHFDITPKAGGAMAYYSWDKGWNQAAFSSLPGLREAAGKPIPPLGLTGEAIPVTASRQIDQKRIQFQADLDNTPLPRPRPDVLQTLKDKVVVAGRPDAPIGSLPAARPDVLSDLRDRVAGIAGKDVTPKLLTTSDGTPQGLVDPRPEMGPGTLNLGADQGLGSLVGPNSIPSATLNPGQVAPPPAPTFQPGMLGRGQVAPVEAPPVPLPRPRPQAPVQVPPVPLPRESRPQTAAPVAPAAPQGPRIALNKDGEPVEIGKTYMIGGYARVGKVGPDGVAYLEKVPVSPFGGMGPGTVAGGMIESGMADAISDISQQTAAAAPILVDSVKEAAGGLADSVGGFFGGLFGGKPQTVAPNTNSMEARDERPSVAPKAPTVAPVSANANRSEARAEQGSQRIAPRAPINVKLPPPTQTADSVARNAISAAPKAPTMTSVPVQSTVPNPAYQQWVERYGDGSQIQTAPTGGLITKNQLAAIQGVTGAVQKPIVKAPPPPPPKTITVTTKKMVPVPAAPATLVKNKTIAPEVRSGGGTTSWGQSKTASDGTSWAANW